MLATIEIYVIFLCFWSNAFVCESKAISIAHIDDNDKLRLNLPALNEVLLRPKIQDKKIMIVSIVGEMRTGKSFIMGFAIRYLQKQGWRNKNWMGDSHTKSNGFIWGPGVERNTNGIDVWDELFTIKDMHGEEVVVILLDTQGLFDHQTTPTNNVRMNAMNMFASSLLIMNFPKHITGRDLENWQLSADFAKLASNADPNVFELPNLSVLVQNWPNLHQYDYGLEGGKDYINHVLGKPDSRQELNSVRQNIKTSFPTRECFLMPFPGENAMQPDFRGTNEEVKEKYLQNVKKYVEHIFDPKKLSIKQLQHKAMTPKMYYNFLVSVDELMNSDKIPSVKNMAEAFGRAVCLNAYEKCLPQFEVDILSHVEKEGILGEKKLEKLYNSNMKLSVQCYESEATTGSQQLKEEFKSKLTEMLEAQFQSIKEKLNMKRKQHVQDIVEEIVNEVEKELRETADKNPTDVDQLKQVYRLLIDKVNKKFDEESANCEPYAKEYKKKLQKEIDKEYMSQLASVERKKTELKENRLLTKVVASVVGGVVGAVTGLVAGPTAGVGASAAATAAVVEYFD